MKNPVILLFSPKEKIRTVLAAALRQCNYRILDASSLALASIKAKQFQPDLILIDMYSGKQNYLVLIKRLATLARTKKIRILVTISSQFLVTVKQLQKEMEREEHSKENVKFQIMEYPFRFGDLLKRIELIFGKNEDPTEGAKHLEGETNARIGIRLFKSGLAVKTKLIEINSTLTKQWAFPFTILKALEIAEKNSSSIGELAKCIESDLGTTSAILKVGNTVYFSKRFGQIKNVSDAIVRIGFRETKTLLSSMALINLSTKKYQTYGFGRNDFWLHSLSTGLIAQKLCENQRDGQPEVAFVAGLLHDIGKIPLDNSFSNVFPVLLDETTARVVPFYETEENFLDFSHATLGHFLANQWNFPEIISNAILNHHKPESILETQNQKEKFIQDAVFVANIFSKILNIGYSCDEIIPEIPKAILGDLEITNGPPPFFFDSIYSKLNTLIKGLNLTFDYPLKPKTIQDTKEYDIMLSYDTGMDFHPLVMALQDNGYRVNADKNIPPELLRRAKINIFFSKKGDPLDVTFGENYEVDFGTASTLKIFILDALAKNEMISSMDKSNVMFVKRKHLDLRLILHNIDSFLGSVTI